MRTAWTSAPRPVPVEVQEGMGRPFIAPDSSEQPQRRCRPPAPVSLDIIIDVYARSLDLLHRLSNCRPLGQAAGERVYATATDELSRGMRDLLALTPVSDSPAMVVAVLGPALERVLATFSIVARTGAPPDNPDPGVLLSPLGAGGAPLPIPVSAARLEGSASILEHIRREFPAALAAHLRSVHGDSPAAETWVRDTWDTVFDGLGELPAHRDASLEVVVHWFWELLGTVYRHAIPPVAWPASHCLLLSVGRMMSQVLDAMGSAGAPSQAAASEAEHLVATLAALGLGHLCAGAWAKRRLETSYADAARADRALCYIAPGPRGEELWNAYVRARTRRRGYQTSVEEPDLEILELLAEPEHRFLARYRTALAGGEASRLDPAATRLRHLLATCSARPVGESSE